MNESCRGQWKWETLTKAKSQILTRKRKKEVQINFYYLLGCINQVICASHSEGDLKVSKRKCGKRDREYESNMRVWETDDKEIGWADFWLKFFEICLFPNFPCAMRWKMSNCWRKWELCRSEILVMWRPLLFIILPWFSLEFDIPETKQETTFIILSTTSYFIPGDQDD